MNATKQLALMALGVMFAVSVAVGETLPLQEGFETMPAAWTNAGGFAILGGGIDGNYLEMIEANDTAPVLTIGSFAAGGYSNVWWRGFARVSAEAQGSTPSDEDIATASAAFFVEDDGGTFVLHARSNDTWVALGNLTNPTNTFIGYAVHLDYVDAKWDLYTTSAGLSGTLTKRNTNGPLAFNNTANATAFTELVVMYDTDLDAFNFLTGAGAVSANTPSEIVPSTISHTTNRWYAGKVADKDYDGDNNLGGALGADLAAGLIPGDRLRVYTDGGWQVYVLEADGRWSMDEADEAPASVSLAAGQPVWFEYSSVITDAFAFFDPDYEPATLAGAVIEPTTLNIRANATAQGWTSLRWDGNRSRSIHPVNQANFPTTLDSGSVIIVIRSDGTYTRGFWTGAAWETIGGAPIVLEPGNAIWVYNETATGATWTPSY